MKSSEAEFLATAAYEASVREVMTTPKPGLVDSEGSGCHDDMDCALFLKSARALAPFWVRQARAGLDGTPLELAAARLRAAGVEMERAMAEATGGVNTHKGLVYLMSLLLYGAGYAVFSGAPRSAEAAADFAALAVRGAVERELGALLAEPPRRALTNGERLYVEHGVTGVRGEAERGFPSVINAGLPALRRALESGASFNDAGLAALLSDNARVRGQQRDAPRGLRILARRVSRPRRRSAPPLPRAVVEPRAALRARAQVHGAPREPRRRGGFVELHIFPAYFFFAIESVCCQQAAYIVSCRCIVTPLCEIL